jgi:DNA repair photolyase
LQEVKSLRDAGTPVGVLIAPIIPALNEKDVEGIIERAAANGATSIGYTCIRLPHELKQLFRERLNIHYPDKAAHIISFIQQMNGGKEYDSNFATRMREQGIFADIIRKRVQVASRNAGLHRAWDTVLDTSKFVAPSVHSPQGELF